MQERRVGNLTPQEPLPLAYVTSPTKHLGLLGLVAWLSLPEKMISPVVRSSPVAV